MKLGDLGRERRINQAVERINELCATPETRNRTARWLSGQLESASMRNTTIRLPDPMLERIDRLLADERFAMRYGKVKRSDVIREAIIKGLEALEREHGKGDA